MNGKMDSELFEMAALPLFDEPNRAKLMKGVAQEPPVSGAASLSPGIPGSKVTPLKIDTL